MHHWVLVDGCCSGPSLPARGGTQPLGTPFPAQPLHRHVKKKIKMGLFDFKLQNSSLEPSANTGNLLYSCLDLFLYIFF